jgi:hypothetical protein
LATTREEASAALERGFKAFEQANYSAAAPDLELGVKSGGLSPDAYCSAAVKLAVCYAADGKFDEANTLLDQLERGAPNMDEVYAARSYVLKKQGKAVESRAALAKARQRNRAIQEFK